MSSASSDDQSKQLADSSSGLGAWCVKVGGIDARLYRVPRIALLSREALSSGMRVSPARPTCSGRTGGGFGRARSGRQSSQADVIGTAEVSFRTSGALRQDAHFETYQVGEAAAATRLSR